MINKILLSIVILLIGLFIEEKLNYISSLFESKQFVPYVIGILSSRDHFEQRAIIRQTWLSSVSDIRYYFIIGTEICNLTTTVRSNPYDCDEVKLKASLSTSTNLSVFKLIESPSSNNLIYSSYLFELNTDLTIYKLGALSQVFQALKSIKLILIDQSNKKVILTSMIEEAKTFEFNDDYVYFDLEKPLQLSRGFVGRIKFEGAIEKINSTIIGQIRKFETVRSDDFNLLKILNIESDHQTKSSNYRILLSSFQYFITNRTKIEIKLQNLKAEKRIMQENHYLVESKLKEESRIYRDLEFVNTIDVYRNLPDKLLKFLSYIAERYTFDYLIKTDDDSYLNLSNIRQYISSFKYSKTAWFGNFRKNWQINELGKWTELDYQSVVYPPFPCGAAYVFSSYLVYWLNANTESLHRYQGEDVSTGIWLASILPDYKSDERWICDKDTYFRSEHLQNNFFCIGQLTTTDQVRLFKSNLQSLR